MKFYIPINKYGIDSAYYSINDYGNLLRKNKTNPEIIQFLADMMEQ